MIRTAMVLLAVAAANAAAQPALSDDQRNTSRALGYDLQYRVYTPPSPDRLRDLPALYVTDGQAYISIGGMPWLLDQLIEAGEIRPVLVVFVDSRNPDRPDEDRRRSQFICNRDFIRFVTEELIPEIDARYPTRPHRDARTIMGLSLGGLNAACFGLHAPEAFRGLGLQSPALRRQANLVAQFDSLPRRDLRWFVSTGTVNDGEARTRALRAVLEAKGYAAEYVEVPFGHNWRNWRPLLDDVLRFFYGW